MLLAFIFIWFWEVNSLCFGCFMLYFNSWKITCDTGCTMWKTFICFQYVVFLLFFYCLYIVFFLVGCSNMTFGQDCNNTCGHCLNNDVCHHVNGTCLRGCNPGYHGDLCAARKKITLHNTNVHEDLIFSYWKTENMCVLVLFFLLNLSFYCCAHLQRFDTPKYLKIQN